MSLTIAGVTRHFAGLEVLAGIDLEVREGERHALIGPNGAGKSTLFNLISGRLRPSAGTVSWRGRRIDQLAPHHIARLGIGRSFQIVNVFPNLSVFANVRSAVASRRGLRLGAWRPLAGEASVAAETERLLAAVGLELQAAGSASALAYGEQRRLEIALTLALDPQLVLLDEPCAGLNAQDTASAVALMRRVTEGRTLLMVEHDMDVVFGLADRISVLHYGRILATGTPAEIRGDRQVQQAYLGRKASVAGG